MQQVLVVSGDTSLLHRLMQRMAVYDIEVLAAQRGEQALEVIHHHSLELIVLSEHLPDFNANELCRLIRTEGYTAIAVIVLNEGGSVHDMLASLESGADSVLPWPFPEDELIERMRARLRYARMREGEHQLLQVGNLLFDTEAHEAWCNGLALPLSKREYDLLKLLASNAGRVLTKEVIFEHIWGSESRASLLNIKVYITALRRKLSACGEAHIIHARRCIGYVLKP